MKGIKNNRSQNPPKIELAIVETTATVAIIRLLVAMQKMKMKKITYYTLIVIVLTACGQSKSKTDKKEQQRLTKHKNEEIITELSNKFSIKYSFKNPSYNYSIEFEDLLNKEYLLVSDFRIQDIYRQDSIAFVKVETGYYPIFYLNLRISKKEQEKLLTLDNSYYSSVNAVMVIKLQEIRKIDLNIDSYPEASDYSYVKLESSMDFAGKGQVIEIRILNE